MILIVYWQQFWIGACGTVPGRRVRWYERGPAPGEALRRVIK